MEKAPCRSIFKNGTDRTTQAEVTRIWAAFINQAERASTISRGKTHSMKRERAAIYCRLSEEDKGKAPPKTTATAYKTNAPC